MGRRRQARETALQALYITDVSGVDRKEAFNMVNRREGIDDPKTLEFARQLVIMTWSVRADIDRHIAAAAENWSLARMAAVDRNLLRLAAYELIHDKETPVNVIIDEAIEIARKYSTEDSTRFINGILDKLKEERKGG